LREIAADVHALQLRIMAQAAARAHPHLYRLLGGSSPASPNGGNDRG
jgi:hypothetical protein